MLFAVKNNVPKIICNWFLTFRPENFEIICNLQSVRNKMHELMGTQRYIICLFMLLFMHLFMDLCERKKNFITDI